MKKEDRIKKKTEETISKIRVITRHIRNVEDNCLLLGEKLIQKGEISLGISLIANGHVHDVSKFGGAEWEFITSDPPVKEENAKLKLKMIINHHNKTNMHHPEFWEKIQNMPKLFLAEMVCDWKARSEEFGTSLRDWINDEATKRFNFTKEEPVYKNIMEYVTLLCSEPFNDINKL